MKKISILALSALVFSMIGASSVALASDFPDVPDSHFNAEAIKYLKDAGVIEGYPDGRYKPLGKINRAEFVKIIMGAAFDYDPEQDPSGFDIYQLVGLNFSDIVAGEWYIPYLRKAVANGVIDGYPDGTFRPEAEINFSEAAKIIANSFDIDPGDVDPDVWYKEFITALEGKHAIPLSIEFFDEQLTRDEMAEMIWRLKAAVSDRATRTYDEITGEGFVRPSSCAELEARFEEMQVHYYDYGFEDDMVMTTMEEAPVAAPGGPGVERSEKAAEEYSTTNIQVAGVDEADVIKNDGKYIYLIKGDTIRIIDAYPAEQMEELLSFSFGDDFETFYPNEMYVDGDQLIVIGSTTKRIIRPLQDLGDIISPSYYSRSRSKVYVLDISDRNKPSIERTVEFDGNYQTSRKVDDTLYMVINKGRYYYYDYPEMPVDVVPLMRDSAVGEDEKVVPCTEIMIHPKVRDFNYLIAAAIPLDDLDKKVTRKVIVGRGDNVYASRDNLYIVATDWGGFYRSHGDYGTMIYQFGLGDGTIEFKNRGKVRGMIVNQFSMDEHDGNFRIATSEQGWGDKPSSSNMFVLNPEMELIGEIDNIAPGEKIYSVRFMGKRAYMVTFKHIDPLFVIDLSNPRDPKILGKLKIPGYSTYLHPYDENHIMGFGKEVDETIDKDKVSSEDVIYWTAVQGMKIGMFDITDVNKPKEMFKEVIGDRGTYSELLDNHKALLFDREKELLAFPVTVVEIPDEDQCGEFTYSTCPDACRSICVPSECTFENGLRICTADCDGEDSCVQEHVSYGETVFDGAYVYTVNLQDGFKLRGKIDHYDAEEKTDLVEFGFTAWNKSIQRIIYIGENLYSVSRSIVKANNMDDVSEINMIELAGDSYDYGYPEPLIEVF